ncbi:MAG: bifunctional folylpolyglutamate synthase/dihydrofolate synthase [Oscillospiraceae bacterium]|nr:bifunctional folylpolyglutamate synthase/dihydrofolate synthase [Oscillospiraceae bacterium]
MNATQALEYIHSVSWKGSVPGLSRTQELLSRMGDPQKDLKFIHIVGTNGKGSTAAMLASVLRKAGYRTGLYTSPFIFRFHERMQVDGQCISDEELAAITEFVQPHAEAMAEHPTEFELVTAIGFEFFRRQRAEIVVLEAGMGGELDSTNVIGAPEVAVMCNIGYDHTQYLGDTLEKIAATKAGVIKPGCRCVMYPNAPSVEAVVENRCKAVGAPFTVADVGAVEPLTHSLDGQTFRFGGETYTIPLLGRHQLANAAVVLTALGELQKQGWRVPDAAIREGLAATEWPGRFQIVRRDPLFIVDGGHNPQCMDAMAQNIRDYLAGYDLTILTGVLADKDSALMYKTLSPLANRFVTVTPPSPRAMAGSELAAYLRSLGCKAESYDAIPDAVRAAIASARENGGAVLACGSLYMVADIVNAAVEAE